MTATMKFIVLACVAVMSCAIAPLHAQFVSERAVDSTGNAEIEEQKMLLSVLDAATKSSITADVIIKGLNPRKPVVLAGISDTTLLFRNYRLYTVSVVKEGYMYYARKFWPDESAEHTERIELRPLKVGLKTGVEDVTFLGDQTDIYHKSLPALQELVDFLKVNEQVKIMIIGHANGPDSEKRPASFYKKGSEKRAEAVRDYLIQRGIEPERLATKGAGNTQMIYPDPQTEWETQANRRIEIEVIGL
ncbi:MAG: OmpA family protein [Flavobacteriales bacterium]|jgi:outer membrane protein OmpA-like peptidoglycan-associated protein